LKAKPRISNAELQVMRVIWQEAPVTVNVVVGILLKRTSWKRETIRTLIKRLENKKAIKSEKKGRSYRYYPLLSKKECVKADAASIIERAGSAILKPVLTALIEKEELTDEEIDEIQSILDKKAKKE